MIALHFCNVKLCMQKMSVEYRTFGQVVSPSQLCCCVAQRKKHLSKSIRRVEIYRAPNGRPKKRFVYPQCPYFTQEDSLAVLSWSLKHTFGCKQSVGEVLENCHFIRIFHHSVISCPIQARHLCGLQQTRRFSSQKTSIMI